MAAGVVPREGEALLGEVSQVVAGIASVKADGFLDFLYHKWFFDYKPAAS